MRRPRPDVTHVLNACLEHGRPLSSTYDSQPAARAFVKRLRYAAPTDARVQARITPNDDGPAKWRLTVTVTREV